ERVTFDRGFSDLWIGDLDGDGVRDFVAAGDNAIRISSAYSPTYGFPLEVHAETELLAGKPFRWLAVGDFGGSPAKDILYVTDDGHGAIELGLAIQIQAHPLVFETIVLGTDTYTAPGNPPLAFADLDGDGKPDVIAGGSEALVYWTALGELRRGGALDPIAVAAGDIDGD